MKRKIVICALMLLCFCLVSSVCAESFDPSQYTYEELVLIREKADETIKEMDRQYAIEHGDRKIIFDQESYMVYLKSPLKLEPAVEKVLETAPDKTKLVWESSDETVAKVANGTVTPVATGKAMITAKASDNELIFGSCEVQVINAVSKLTSEETAFVLALNVQEMSEKTLSVEVLPEDALYRDVEWFSSDENVVSVDENGKIKAVGLGSAKVSAKSKDPFKYQKVPQIDFKVTVVNMVTGIEVSSDSQVLGQGKTQSIEYKVIPEDATNQKMEFISSDPAVVAVAQGGKMTGKGGGECVITVKAVDGSEASATFRIKVVVPVKSIQLDKRQMTAFAGLKSEPLVAMVSPSDAEYQGYTWSSSDETVATVNDKGEVTGVAGGTAIITATSAEPVPEPKSASCKVTVTQAVEYIGLEQDFDKSNDSKLVLKITVLPETASNKSVEWSSSDTSVATVSNGVVKIKPHEGSATITAKAKDGSGIYGSCTVNVGFSGTVIQIGSYVHREGAYTWSAGNFGGNSDPGYLDKAAFDETAFDLDNISSNAGFEFYETANGTAWLYDSYSEDEKVTNADGDTVLLYFSILGNGDHLGTTPRLVINLKDKNENNIKVERLVLSTDTSVYEYATGRSEEDEGYQWVDFENNEENASMFESLANSDQLMLIFSDENSNIIFNVFKEDLVKLKDFAKVMDENNILNSLQQ